MLTNGKKGVGFGVGVECLPDLFASMGCEILATDLDAESAIQKGWLQTDQNSGGNIRALNRLGFCDENTFTRMVHYRDVNMNRIPDDIREFDFCWSSCALEHLGSLKKGLDFIENSMDCLKPGGIAVHTTEYNLYSNETTYEGDNCSIYRKKDIEQLVKSLEMKGCSVAPIDWHLGSSVVDGFVDVPPYFGKNMHLRLDLEGFVSTSIGLIIRRDR